jgi:hypothetical protein
VTALPVAFCAALDAAILAASAQRGGIAMACGAYAISVLG